MKKIAIGIMFLFIISSMTTTANGYNIEKNEIDDKLEEMLDNLRFICTDANGFSEQKFEHYINYLLVDYPNNAKIIKSDLEESTIISNSLLKTLTFGPNDSAWPLSCHDIHHTSQSPYTTANITSAEKWRFVCGWAEDTPVIDSGGTIYIGCNDRYLYAINPDGTEKWKYKAGGIIWGSSPAIAEDGTIYVGSWDTKLYAINPDGTEKWKIGTGGSISSSPVIADDGTIYIGTLSSGDSIIAVNSNGTIKWSYLTGYSIASDPAIGDDGTIYCGSGDTYLYALWPDGSLRWRFKTGDEIHGPPSIADDGTIYIGSYDTYLYAINPDGTQKWKCYIGYGIATNPSIANDGTIYVGGDKVYAVYPNGTRSWSFDIGAEGHIDSSSPAISSDGTIYVGTNIGGPSDGGEIIAINPDGTEKWRKKIANKWVESSPSIAEDGNVYIGSTYDIGGGYLHAFGTVENNEPPITPTITGPTSGNAGVSHTYTFISNDPENYPVKYYVEWGDDTHSGWTGEYESGEEVTISHTWSEKGTYTIRAKVMDISNDESDWGTLTVTMPRNRITQNTLFYKILEHFSFLTRLLNIY